MKPSKAIFHPQIVAHIHGKMLVGLVSICFMFIHTLCVCCMLGYCSLHSLSLHSNCSAQAKPIDYNSFIGVTKQGVFQLHIATYKLNNTLNTEHWNMNNNRQLHIAQNHLFICIFFPFVVHDFITIYTTQLTGVFRATQTSVDLRFLIKTKIKRNYTNGTEKSCKNGIWIDKPTSMTSKFIEGSTTKRQRNNTHTHKQNNWVMLDWIIVWV